MKSITAIIQPHMLNRVLARLHALPHFPGVTVTPCQGQGRGKGPGGVFQPDEASIDLIAKVRLELYCTDAASDELVKLIQTSARTGNPGDGIIVVGDLDRVVRIRTGQEQDGAV